MIGDVEQLPKNLRYKLLMVRGDYYLLDMDRNFWLFLFPFLNWFFIHKIYQLDMVTAEGMREEKKKEKGSIIALALGGGVISVSLNNLTMPIIERLTIDTSIVVNVIIFFIVLVPAFYIRIQIKNNNKNKIEHQISLETRESYQVQLKPIPHSFMFLFLLLCFFFWIFAIFGILFFFIYGNVFALLVGVTFMFLMFLINNQAIRPGKAEVKFKE